MGYRPPVPWSMPDQDEPETWATWSGRHRPPVRLADEPLAERPEEGYSWSGLIMAVVLGLVCFGLAMRFGIFGVRW